MRSSSLPLGDRGTRGARRADHPRELRARSLCQRRSTDSRRTRARMDRDLTAWSEISAIRTGPRRGSGSVRGARRLNGWWNAARGCREDRPDRWRVTARPARLAVTRSGSYVAVAGSGRCRAVLPRKSEGFRINWGRGLLDAPSRSILAAPRAPELARTAEVPECSGRANSDGTSPLRLVEGRAETRFAIQF